MLRFILWPLQMLRRMWRRLRSPRSLKLTREGKFFVAITIGIGLAAINTGNNLLYLLLGWLLSVIVASGVLSNISLRGIRISRRLPKRIYANTPFLIELDASNEKKHLASYSLQIEDLCEGSPVDKRCYFLKIPQGKSQKTSYRHTISRRGVHRFDGFRISTKFPFGLFIKRRKESGNSELLVFPETYQVPAPPPLDNLRGEEETRRVGRHGDFFGLREYRQGDDRRSIHWRSSARQNRLLVREYEDESQRRLTLVIDNALPHPHGEDERNALEDAISLCASLAKAYLEKGYSLRLISRAQSIPFAAGEMHLQRVLRTLALLPIAEEKENFPELNSGAPDTLLVTPKGVATDNRPAIRNQLEAA